MTQAGLAEVCGIDPSKISRLLKDETRADRDDLEAILSAFHDATDRFRIVIGHIHDEIPTTAIPNIEIKRADKPNAIHETVALDLRYLSERGESALAYLVELKREVPSIEDVFVDLARAFGWTAPDAPLHKTKLTPESTVNYRKKPKSKSNLSKREKN